MITMSILKRWLLGIFPIGQRRNLKSRLFKELYQLIDYTPKYNPAGTPGYRNGTESFFGLKGRPSVVRDVKIHNQPVLQMRRK
jgi:hypothetical protein